MVLRRANRVVVFVPCKERNVVEVVAVQGSRVWKQLWQTATARRLYKHLIKEHGFCKA